MRLATFSACATAVVAVAVARPTLAEPPCPPGGWFCEEARDGTSEADDPADAVRPEAPGRVEAPDRSRSGRPPVVVDHPPNRPPPAIVLDTRKSEPQPPRKRRKREWGLNLHLEGAMMGGRHRAGGPHEDAGMAGLGLSLRYRPVPAFAFDAGLDFVAGTDWEGNDRRETALLLNGMVFFNPRDKFQIYLLAGLGFSGASVSVSSSRPVSGAEGEGAFSRFDGLERYSYFGGQMGLGFEWRLARKTALQLDLVGFVRGRTDDRARFEPEFVDPDTGRTTNSSGGGLVRGGVTFYW